MATDKRAAFKDILSQFSTAMLVTHGEKGRINARPMAIARREDNGTLWFVTSLKSHKMDELTHNPDVAVTFQGDNRFLSIGGHAAFSKDPKKIKDMWSEAWEAWFDGKEDPSIALIRVVPEVAEYWDQSGLKGLKYGFEAVKAYLTDTEVEFDAGQHGEVHFQQTS